MRTTIGTYNVVMDRYWHINFYTIRLYVVYYEYLFVCSFITIILIVMQQKLSNSDTAQKIIMWRGLLARYGCNRR